MITIKSDGYVNGTFSYVYDVQIEDFHRFIEVEE